MRSIRCLYYAGIYRGREIFSIERIKEVCRKKRGIERRQYEWDELFNGLRNKGFIEIFKNEVQAEETYLEYVIEGDLDILNNIYEMMKIFSNDPEALFRIGNQASHIGETAIQMAEYMEAAIKAFEEALEAYTLEDFPMDYAMAQNNLGAAYRVLSDVEDKAENCKRGLKAFEEALRVFTEEEFPETYKLVVNNLIKLLNFCKSE